MDKKFIQNVLNTMMFKKLTTVFPLLKKEKIEDEETKQSLKAMEKDGILSALKDSDQDPQELADMAIEAFDHSLGKIRERFEIIMTLMVAEYKKQNKV